MKNKRGFFREVEKCCSIGADAKKGCPFFSRTYVDDKGYFPCCTRVGIPYRKLSDVPYPDANEQLDGKFPDWCPLLTKKMLPLELEKPDIAFWFDEEDRFIVRVRDGLPLVNLQQAAFELVGKALSLAKDSTVAEWQKKEEDEDEETDEDER